MPTRCFMPPESRRGVSSPRRAKPDEIDELAGVRLDLGARPARAICERDRDKRRCRAQIARASARGSGI